MNLYELSVAFQEVQNMDLDPEVMKDTLDSIEGTLENKLENTVKVIRNRKARITALKTEEDRFKKNTTIGRKCSEMVRNVCGRLFETNWQN